MCNTRNETLKEAITRIYTAFPNLSYTPRPDDVKLLAAYMKSQDNHYPESLDFLLSVSNREIELELLRHKRH